MQRKIVIVVLALALIAAAAWLAARQSGGGPVASQPPQVPDQAADSATPAPAPRSKPAVPAPKQTPALAVSTNEDLADSDEAMAETPAAKQEVYVAKRVAELQDLGMENDSESLDTILSELNNRDPRVREAAVDAAVQFGSRDAIPKLEDAAAQTEDPKEKAAILDAIEFLKLPTLTEAIGNKTQP
jgi:HEAT repeat protein